MEGQSQKGLIDWGVIRRLEALAPPAQSQEFVRELVHIFLDMAPKVLTDLSDALQRQDSNAMVCHAHRLKGLSLNLGATELGQLCEDAEIRFKMDPVSARPDLLTKLAASYAASAAALQSVFAGRP